MHLMLIVWVVLIAAGAGSLIYFFLPNRKKDAEQHEKRLSSLEKQLDSQRDVQSAQLLENAKAERAQPVESEPVLVLRIARQGQDLGEMEIGAIREMLKDQRLSRDDFFLDPERNEWMPLDCHPALI